MPSWIALSEVVSSGKPIGTMRIGSAFDFFATGFVIADLLPESVVYVLLTAGPRLAPEFAFTLKVTAISNEAVYAAVVAVGANTDPSTRNFASEGASFLPGAPTTTLVSGNVGPSTAGVVGRLDLSVVPAVLFLTVRDSLSISM